MQAFFYVQDVRYAAAAWMQRSGDVQGGMYGMSFVQEHTNDDVTGSTVCRGCMDDIQEVLVSWRRGVRSDCRRVAMPRDRLCVS